MMGPSTMEQKSKIPSGGAWAERRHKSCARLQRRRRTNAASRTGRFQRCQKPLTASIEAGRPNKLMNRLPSFDRQTSKGELRLFLGLGLAAAGLIGITCFDAARFSVNRDEIATALSNPAAALAEV